MKYISTVIYVLCECFPFYNLWLPCILSRHKTRKWGGENQGIEEKQFNEKILKNKTTTKTTQIAYLTHTIIWKCCGGGTAEIVVAALIC